MPYTHTGRGVQRVQRRRAIAAFPKTFRAGIFSPTENSIAMKPF
jgi:hypothetical protein